MKPTKQGIFEIELTFGPAELPQGPFGKRPPEPAERHEKNRRRVTAVTDCSKATRQPAGY
jgi:hypothetical protein